MAEEEIKATTAAETTESKTPKSKASKKTKRIVNSGAVHIQSTFNNTIISVTSIMMFIIFKAIAGKINGNFFRYFIKIYFN